MNSNKSRVYLNAIQGVTAPYRLEQKQSIAWLMKALQHARGETSRALNLYERFLSNAHIGSRHSVLADFTHENWDRMELFKPDQRIDGTVTSWFAPPLERRMQVFARESLEMAQIAFRDVHEPPSCLIEVSCTGYDAPYPSQKILLKKGWQNSTRLLKLGHMGCYASVPALNLAADLVRAQDDERPVSILSSELCTLHLAPRATDADQIVANILFADGAARLDLSRVPSPGSLALIDHAETLIPETEACMTWILADSCFRMTLSKKVGFKIGEVLKNQVDTFLHRNGLKRDDIACFAIHPGGPLIIEMVQRMLELEEEKVCHSKTVLKEYGNMSSSTIPHIWAAMQKDKGVAAGALIVSLAFGPGLTLIMNLLAKDL